jgi:hypothetical protein
MAEGKPIFRIDELIEALLKGSPSDPVYLQVGSKKYGIDKIETGVIRVKSGKKTQDAETVVQTLRRFATGAPRDEDTGVAWRIVGVGGGTAIRSVKHEGGKIIVRTLANEGKGRAAESFEALGDPDAPYDEGYDDELDESLGERDGPESSKSQSMRSRRRESIGTEKSMGRRPYSGVRTMDAEGKCVCGVNCICECGCAETGVCNCGDACPCDCGCGVKDAEDNSPTYTPEAYDPLTESPTDYDPQAKTFAAASKRKSKRRRKSDKRRAATPAKRAWNNKVSTKISTIMADYEKTGKIGNSRPKNKAAAMKQAIAVAYSISAREYKKTGKRLPSGIKAAEGEQSRPFR